VSRRVLDTVLDTVPDTVPDMSRTSTHVRKTNQNCILGLVPDGVPDIVPDTMGAVPDTVPDSPHGVPDGARTLRDHVLDEVQCTVFSALGPLHRKAEI
jgi:hypothetical protein